MAEGMENSEMKDSPTSRRSDHIASVRHGTGQALIQTAFNAFEKAKKVQPYDRMALPAILFQQMRDQINVESASRQMMRGFLTEFFRIPFKKGHDRVQGLFVPRLHDVYGGGAIEAARVEITVPLLHHAINLVSLEINDGVDVVDVVHETPDMPMCWPRATSQIHAVFDKASHSQFKEYDSAFNALVWTVGYRFTFAEGRPARCLFTKDPVDIVERDAVEAFIPHLFGDEDEDDGDEDDQEEEDQAEEGKERAQEHEDEGKKDSEDEEELALGDNNHTGGGSDIKDEDDQVDPPDDAELEYDSDHETRMLENDDDSEKDAGDEVRTSKSSD